MEPTLTFKLTCLSCCEAVLSDVTFDELLQSEAKVREHKCGSDRAARGLSPSYSDDHVG
jgi:hypothetical protein